MTTAFGASLEDYKARVMEQTVEPEPSPIQRLIDESVSVYRRELIEIVNETLMEAELTIDERISLAVAVERTAIADWLEQLHGIWTYQWLARCVRVRDTEPHWTAIRARNDAAQEADTISTGDYFGKGEYIGGKPQLQVESDTPIFNVSLIKPDSPTRITATVEYKDSRSLAHLRSDGDK